MDEKKMLGVLLHLTEQQSATTSQLLEQLQAHVSTLEAATKAAVDATPAAAKAAGDATRTAVQQSLGQTQKTALEAFTQAARPYFLQLNKAKDDAHEAADRLQKVGQWAWVFAAGVLLVAGMASWTWMKWQQGQLVDLQQQRAALQVDVDQLRVQVADLEKRGGRIKLAKCDTNRLCIEAANNQGGGQTDWVAPWSSPTGQKYVIPKGY